MIDDRKDDEQENIKDSAATDSGVEAATTWNCMGNNTDEPDGIYDRFATQFLCSLTKMDSIADGGDGSVWFGRLIKFNYNFVSASGNSFTTGDATLEQNLRDALRSEKIKSVRVFGVDYAPVGGADPHVVITGKVEIIEVKGGETIFQAGMIYDFRHEVVQTWQTRKTEFSL